MFIRLVKTKKMWDQLSFYFINIFYQCQHWFSHRRNQSTLWELALISNQRPIMGKLCETSGNSRWHRNTPETSQGQRVSLSLAQYSTTGANEFCGLGVDSVYQLSNIQTMQRAFQTTMWLPYDAFPGVRSESAGVMFVHPWCHTAAGPVSYFPPRLRHIRPEPSANLWPQGAAWGVEISPVWRRQSSVSLGKEFLFCAGINHLFPQELFSYSATLSSAPISAPATAPRP